MSTQRNRTWVSTKLSEVTCVVRERVIPSEHPELPFVGMDNVEAHTMRLLGTVPSTTVKSASVRFHPGDVLYGRLRPYLNKVIAPEFDGLASAEFIPLTMPDGIDPKFVQYRINAADFVSYAARLDEGDRPRVDYGQIGEFRVDLPPSTEQHRIVSAVESYFTWLDDAVATLERVQRNLKRYRASVLKAAVEGSLVSTQAELARAGGRSYEPASVLLKHILAERRRRWEEAEVAKMAAKGKAPKDDKWKAKYVEPVAPDTSDLPELPEGWCWASCAQLLQRLQTGPFGSSLHKSDYVTRGIPVINPEHLRNYRILPSERVGVSSGTVARLSAFVLRAGDIVLGRRGEMGRCALVGSREDGWLLGTGSLALRPLEGVVGGFLSWVLRSPRSVRTLEGESVGTTMTNLNQEILLNLPIPLAPTDEQSRIAREIERHFSVIDALDLAEATQRLRCTRLRQAILKWAFEGRLVGQDPADEPASVLLERIGAERAAANNAPLVAPANGKTPTRPRRKARTNNS